jgi:hypothetical protein
MLLNGKSYGVPDDNDASIDGRKRTLLSSKEDEYADADFGPSLIIGKRLGSRFASQHGPDPHVNPHLLPRRGPRLAGPLLGP